MHAVIFGAGKIARGFVGHLLYVSGIPFTFVEKNRELVDLINRRETYHIEVMGNPTLNTEVLGARAIALEDYAAVARVWADAPIAFTCVGGKNLEELATHLVRIVEERHALKGCRTSLITCENWREPAALLQSRLSSGLPSSIAEQLGSRFGFSEAVIMRSAVEPTAAELSRDPLWVNVQDYWELPVDRSKILGDPIPVVGIQYIEGFSGFLERKFYTYNAANGTAAYLGYLRGHRYIFEAANDPLILAALQGVYAETGAALVSKHKITTELQNELIGSSLRKLKDRNIVDYIERNARDPIRKLGPTDRLVGSARLAMNFGTEPRHLARSIAAAIHYDEPSDPSAQELQVMLSQGIDVVLTKVCQIEPNDPLSGMIKCAVNELRAEGLIK